MITLPEPGVQVRNYHIAATNSGDGGAFTADQMRAYAAACVAAETAALRKDNANLKTVMVAAAEEIAAHWDAHCDAEGYGPANLMHRLERGIPSQYGYTAGAFEALRKDAAQLREWAKVAFRALNNVGPVLLSLEGESTEEAELTAKLYQMVESACWQYPAITGVNYIEAAQDARQALEGAAIRAGCAGGGLE